MGFITNTYWSDTQKLSYMSDYNTVKENVYI